MSWIFPILINYETLCWLLFPEKLNRPIRRHRLGRWIRIQNWSIYHYREKYLQENNLSAKFSKFFKVQNGYKDGSSTIKETRKYFSTEWAMENFWSIRMRGWSTCEFHWVICVLNHLLFIKDHNILQYLISVPSPSMFTFQLMTPMSLRTIWDMPRFVN